MTSASVPTLLLALAAPPLIAWVVRCAATARSEEATITSAVTATCGAVQVIRSKHVYKHMSKQMSRHMSKQMSRHMSKHMSKDADVWRYAGNKAQTRV